MADNSHGTRKNRQSDLMLICLYLKAYQKAIRDFEHAVKYAGYADTAQMSVEQKYKERIDRFGNDMHKQL